MNGAAFSSAILLTAKEIHEPSSVSAPAPLKEVVVGLGKGSTDPQVEERMTEGLNAARDPTC